MRLTPICYYDPDCAEHETRCSRCGRLIQYVHIVLSEDEKEEIPFGLCCVRRMKKSGEIINRLPRNGRYDWKMLDVREDAYWRWYASSIEHAEH